MNKKTLFLVLLSIIVSISIIPLAITQAACSTPGANQQLNNIATNVKNAAIAVGSILTVIGFVVAGIMWLVSGGSPEKTGTAKKALIAAVIGASLIAISSGVDIFQNIICNTLGV